MSINPPAGPVPGHTDPPSPAAARVRVRRWLQDGSTYRAIATAAGLDRATVRDLAPGRRQPKRGTAAAVLAVPGDAIARARLDAGGTRLRLRALHVMGHGSARIARALGVRERPSARSSAATPAPSAPGSATRSADLYDAWWDKRAPARTRADRGAATAARKRAIAGNWCAPAALDDDLLDIPGYRPRHGWKPAAGTGVAPDVRPACPPPPEGPPMTADHRVTPGLVHDILDALERHGYYRSDDQHADRAIGLIGDLAGIYEGTQDHPASRLHGAAARPAYPGPSRAAPSPLPATTPAPCSPRRYRRRRQALPRRDVPRLRRPVLPRLPDPPARHRGLRPDGRPHAPGRPGPRPLPRPAVPARIAGPSPPPTGRQASDALPPETGSTSPPPSRYAPHPWPAGQESGTCRKPPNPTTCRSPTSGRPAAPST